MEIKFSNSSIFEFICLIVVGELSRQFAGSEEQAHKFLIQKAPQVLFQKSQSRDRIKAWRAQKPNNRIA